MDREQSAPKKILGSEKLGEIFNTKAKPIPMDALIRGLCSVIEKVPSIAQEIEQNGPNTTITENALYNLVCASMYRYGSAFDRTATSSFAQILDKSGWYSAIKWRGTKSRFKPSLSSCK